MKMIKYFYSKEFELGDDELCELYHEIKSGIDKKLDAISRRGYYTEYKTAATAKQKNKQGRSILLLWVCIRSSDIDFTLTAQTGMWHIPVKIIKNEGIE